MKKMQETLFTTVVKRPWLVLVGLLVVIFLAASGAKNLTFKSDYRVFFGKTNPELAAFEKMQATFTKNDNVIFILAPKSGEVFTPDTLEAIHWLTNESWQIPYSNRVDSITNYQHTVADGDSLYVEDLLLEPEMLPEKDMEYLKKVALSEPILQKKLISEDARITVVNATIQMPGIDPVTELPEIVTKVREIRDTFVSEFPEFDVHLSGMIMMNNTFSESSLNDFSTLFPAMFGMVALVMVLLLRTITGAVATLLIVIFSIITTMGLAGWMGFYLTGPSASAPTMILTLAVADCIHILSSMIYEMRHHRLKKREAILESLRINMQPVFLTSATTAIGFLSLNFSDSPPFNDLGNLVAIGVMLAFLFSITIFPAILCVLPINIKPKEEHQSDLMSHVAEFVITKKNVLLPVFSILIVFLIAFVPQNELNDNFIEYFDESVPFRAATDFMEENMSGLMTQEIEIDSKESSGINSPEYLAVLANFSDWVRQQPETENVSVLSDILRRLNKNMHGDDESYYKLPEDRELSAQYLLMYEMSLPYGLDLNNQIDVDKAATRLVVTTKNLTSTQNLEFEKRMEDWFTENAADFKVTVASPTLMFAHIGQRNIQSMLVGTSVALVLISVLLGIALRSVKMGFISLIPNLAPAAMGFGVWYFIDGEVGLALSVVAGMTLGIVVDDTVHFMSKYLRARRLKQLDTEAAVRYAFSSVGKALWVTTLVLIAGFMVLAQSSFKVNAGMGLLTAITIAIALIVDFFFLPPLLMKLDKHKASTQSQPAGEMENV